MTQTNTRLRRRATARPIASQARQLFARQLRAGLFGERFEVVQEVHRTDEMVVISAPALAGKRLVRGDSAAECPLCNPSVPGLEHLGWRAYDVTVNAYPISPVQGAPLIISDEAHRPQAADLQMLSDMIDFQGSSAPEQQSTLVFNGGASSIRSHLHWQSLALEIPVQAVLERAHDAHTEHRNHLTSEQGSVDSFHQESGYHSGILVRGTKAFVVRAAGRLFRLLELEPACQGNLTTLLIPQRDGQVRLCIFPMRVGRGERETIEGQRTAFTATASGGLIAMRSEMSELFPSTITERKQEVRLPPAALSWLDRLDPRDFAGRSESV